nr:eukaryotic translation initiation factor-like [Parasteatoda tepidariorum]
MNCIKRLISQGDEVSLKCLCQLLKRLDDRKVKGSKKSMENYFLQMQKIVDKRLISSRVRFMLQDVIDLNRNDWVLRNMYFQNIVPHYRERRKNTARNMRATWGWMSSTKSSKDSATIPLMNKLQDSLFPEFLWPRRDPVLHSVLEYVVQVEALLFHAFLQ